MKMRKAVGIVQMILSIIFMSGLVTMVGYNQDFNLLSSQKEQASEIAYEASKIGAVQGARKANELISDPENALSATEIEQEAMAATILATCKKLAELKIIGSSSSNYINSVQNSSCIVPEADKCATGVSVCKVACEANENHGQVLLTGSINCN
jgi:hypothetical protein